jgi:putative zinc finger/helix-turn-helix YgiT family protein
VNCPECGRPVIIERDAVRRYGVGGLPHVELHGIEVSRCTSCGNEAIAIPRVAQLHRVLAARIVRQHRMLAPVEIRFLRKHMGMSSTNFAQRMGVARETVSRWETGASPIGAVADRLVRLLVAAHEPSDSYVVDDLLRELTDAPAPATLLSVAVRNGGKRGWGPG